MKKYLNLALALVLCASMLCACGSNTGNGDGGDNPGLNAENQQGTNDNVDNNTPDTPAQDEDGMKEIVLADYLGNDAAWETDGGDVYVEDTGITFDNAFMGDFAALRLTEDAKNVTYKFTLQLQDIPQDLSVDEGTFWDAELLILLRSTLAAPAWEEGQTGYCLTAWGDMKELYIGRAGHDDAFGSIEWNVWDGQPHDIEFSAINNEDDTTVTLKLVIDGEVVFETVDDGSITKEDRPSLFPDAGGLTIRCKYLKAIIQ